jgi:hypothetical protein
MVGVSLSFDLLFGFTAAGASGFVKSSVESLIGLLSLQPFAFWDRTGCTHL